MRKYLALLLLLVIGMIPSVTGCPANEESREAVEEQPLNLQDGHEANEVTDEEQPVEYEGTDIAEFVDTWVSLGESERDLRLRLNLYEEIDLLLLTEWHIARITSAEEEEYAMNFEGGSYIIQALGGEGIERLDLYIVDPASEIEEFIAYDDQENNIPKIEHEFEEANSVLLLFDPLIFEQGYDSGWYCWFLLEQE